MGNGQGSIVKQKRGALRTPRIDRFRNSLRNRNGIVRNQKISTLAWPLLAGKDILKGLNLTVERGEVHAIMGKNGSGKSTLSQVLAGREAYEVTEGNRHL